MNFKKLQAMQAKLDEAILAEKAPMTAEERFNKTLVALSVEIAEVANTVEHFKFWKDNKGKVDEKRFEKLQPPEYMKEFVEIQYWDKKEKKTISFEQAHRLTLIEECSDALHFILSLANQVDFEIGIKNWTVMTKTKESNLMYINRGMFQLFESYEYEQSSVLYIQCKFIIVILGVFSYFNQLGIEPQELEQAYYDKNKINYERLENGY